MPGHALIAVAILPFLLGGRATAGQSAVPPAEPPAQSAQAPAAPLPAVGGLVFGSEVGIVINAIKPDKAAEFEAVVQRLREALERSTDPVRQQQAASWRIFKAEEPGPAGAVLYLFLFDPPVKGADYTVSRLLGEAFPEEVAELWPKLRDAYAAALHRLGLQTVVAIPPEPPAGVE